MRNGIIGLQIRKVHEPFRKLSDRQCGSVDRNVFVDAVHTRAVRQPRIHDRVQFIDLPMHLPGDAAQHLLQFTGRIKAIGIALDLAMSFDKNILRSVDHDLRHSCILQQWV